MRALYGTDYANELCGHIADGGQASTWLCNTINYFGIGEFVDASVNSDAVRSATATRL